MPLKKLLNFIFPRQCVGCGNWVSYICSNCLNFLKTCDNRICPICSRPSLSGLTHIGCKRVKSLDGLTSIFVYKGLFKKVLHKLKYRQVTDLSKTILELFLSLAGEDQALYKFILPKKVCLIPIPLPFKEKNWRGFNQSELMGKKIADKLEINYDQDVLKMLMKTKKVKDKNLNIFISNYPYILLFNDVWITGASLREYSKLLKQNGFKKVWGLTLARSI
ncbi:ComF family protein [Patescibacteria group bacterium]